MIRIHFFMPYDSRPCHVDVTASGCDIAVPTILVDDVFLIVADGKELNLLRDRFDGVPFHVGSCSWRSPFARFVYENLLQSTTR